MYIIDSKDLKAEMSYSASLPSGLMRTTKKPSKDASTSITSFHQCTITAKEKGVLESKISGTDIVYKSLLHYQNQIRVLKGGQKLMNLQHNFGLKRQALTKIREHVRSKDNCLQPLINVDLEELQKMDANQLLERQFTSVLEQRMNIQKHEQIEFINLAKNQVIEDTLNGYQGVRSFGKILQNKSLIFCSHAFAAIKFYIQLKQSVKKSEQIIKYSRKQRFSNKINKISKQKINQSFRRIWKYSYITIRSKDDLRYKGMFLSSLKEYSRLNLKKALWRWYLDETTQGRRLFQRVADRLVLYTYCNKTTAFYRLLNQIRGKNLEVSIEKKRKKAMIKRILKSIFGKQQIYGFNMIMLASKKSKQRIIGKMLQISKIKQINCINLQFKNTKIKNQQCLNEFKLKQIKFNILSKLFRTRTGRIAAAFIKWKGIPYRKDVKKFQNISKFQKGLNDYLVSTVKKSYLARKNLYQQGQAVKNVQQFIQFI